MLFAKDREAFMAITITNVTSQTPLRVERLRRQHRRGEHCSSTHLFSWALRADRVDGL